MPKPSERINQIFEEIITERMGPTRNIPATRDKFVREANANQKTIIEAILRYLDERAEAATKK